MWTTTRLPRGDAAFEVSRQRKPYSLPGSVAAVIAPARPAVKIGAVRSASVEARLQHFEMCGAAMIIKD
jgi:hypothetical protein